MSRNTSPGDLLDSASARKRQKMAHLNSSESLKDWGNFLEDVRLFEIQFVDGKGKFSFAFVEGPLIRALRSGTWSAVNNFHVFFIRSVDG